MLWQAVEGLVIYLYSFFSFSVGWIPVAIYLIQSVASFSVSPLLKSQSMSLAASVAVMLSSILSTSCPVYSRGYFPVVFPLYQKYTYVSSVFFKITQKYFAHPISTGVHFYAQNTKVGETMRNPEYKFVDTKAEDIEARLVQGYERITGKTCYPASPERVFVQWVASIVTYERVLNNYTGNQNIPSRADGENLDALAELLYIRERPKAQAAGCTQRFYISEPQLSAILVPKGTRVTNSGGLIWETVEDVYIPIGETFADAQMRCQTLGVTGNGYTPGQLDTLVDLYDYYSKTENITTSDGGADAATDEEFYELMRASMDAYSCAGPGGAMSISPGR